MLLYTSCNNCGEKHKLNKYYSTRVDFKMYEGNQYKGVCKLCNKAITQDVRKIYAGYSALGMTIVATLCLIASAYAYHRVSNYTPDFTPTTNGRTWYAIPLIPFIVFLVYRSNERTKISAFNRT